MIGVFLGRKPWRDAKGSRNDPMRPPKSQANCNMDGSVTNWCGRVTIFTQSNSRPERPVIHQLWAIFAVKMSFK